MEMGSRNPTDGLLVLEILRNENNATILITLLRIVWEILLIMLVYYPIIATTRSSQGVGTAEIFSTAPATDEPPWYHNMPLPPPLSRRVKITVREDPV